MNTILREINVPATDSNDYPFNLPLFKNGLNIKFDSPITFIIGENGSGKSTLLENLAVNIGFNPIGGNLNHRYSNEMADNFELAENMKLTWSIKQSKGFFFRAESFLEFARQIDIYAKIPGGGDLYAAYGGKSLQAQSHGESFMAFFRNKVADGIYIIDEPESALSPERQFALIVLLQKIVKKHNCQFIIATHSPLLIACPNSSIYEIEDGKIIQKPFEQTKQFRLYKDFVLDPKRYIYYLCKDEEE